MPGRDRGQAAGGLCPHPACIQGLEQLRITSETGGGARQWHPQSAAFSSSSPGQPLLLTRDEPRFKKKARDLDSLLKAGAESQVAPSQLKAAEFVPHSISQGGCCVLFWPLPPSDLRGFEDLGAQVELSSNQLHLAIVFRRSVLPRGMLKRDGSRDVLRGVAFGWTGRLLCACQLQTEPGRNISAR